MSIFDLSNPQVRLGIYRLLEDVPYENISQLSFVEIEGVHLRKLIELQMLLVLFEDYAVRATLGISDPHPVDALSDVLS